MAQVLVRFTRNAKLFGSEYVTKDDDIEPSPREKT
jgi:hypothetical protein